MKQIHIKCGEGDVGKIVLLPGDPARATFIGEKFLKGKHVATNREFVTYTGEYKGVKVSVTSTGIGGPSAAIATEELLNIGAKVLIRVGTCGGGLKKEIKQGSIIIPTAAIRHEGTTKEYVPLEWPAVADFDIVTILRATARKLKFPHFVGLDRTHDAFYGQKENWKYIGSLYNDPRMKNWDVPLVSSEMECSVIFLIALLRGVKAGAVLAVDSDPEPIEDIVNGKLIFTTPNKKWDDELAKIAVEREIITVLESVGELNKLV